VINVRKIEPLTEPEVVLAVADIYRKSFAGAPWFEGYICPVCRTVVPLEHENKLCSHCIKEGKSILLIERWPLRNVINDLYSEMTKPDAVCTIATDSTGKIIGFAWGYRIEVDEEMASHLEAPELHIRTGRGPFFYLDEVALLPDCQAKGIGKILTRYTYDHQPYGHILLRTKKDSRMHHLTLGSGGFVIQEISDDRVIMGLSWPSV